MEEFYKWIDGRLDLISKHWRGRINNINIYKADQVAFSSSESGAVLVCPQIKIRSFLVVIFECI